MAIQALRTSARHSSTPSLGTALAARLELLRLTISGAVLLLVCAAGWALARHLGSKSAYLLVYAGVLSMLVSWGAARNRMKLTVERSRLPARMREGQPNSVTLTAAATRRQSAFIVREVLPESFGSDVEVPVAELSPGTDIEHRYEFTPRRRGVYDVGPLWATWTDPFGLTMQQQQLLPPVEVIVHPSTEGVDDRILARMWEDPPVRPPVSKPWPTGFEFYGMRDYVPGDDLRQIVWSAVAKTGRMLVRESEQGITDRISIVIDNGRDHHSKGAVSETFELAVRIAASVARKHVDDGFSVSLLCNEGRLATGVRGGPAGTVLLDHLARLHLTKATGRIAGELLLGDARSGAHFIVITAHVDKEMTNRLRMVLERGASITIAKILWEETDPLSLARASSLGCRVVQLPLNVSISGSFAHQVGGGLRR